MATPRMPGLQPWPWAFTTASMMHLRTPLMSRPAPMVASGRRYWAPTFSQPPPFCMTETSTSGRSHSSKWMAGWCSWKGSMLLPLFLPLRDSTQLGRSQTFFVAWATASRICFLAARWLSP